MKTNFNEQLALYKEGELEEEAAREIKEEIDRASAIIDYLQEEDAALWTNLQAQIPDGGTNEPNRSRLIKRKINLRIVATTLFTALFVWIAIVTLTLLTSKLTNHFLAFDYKEAYVERASLTQIVQMFQPDYEVRGSSSTSGLFAKESMSVRLDRNAGHTLLDSKEITVNYQFAQPKTANTSDGLFFLHTKEDFSSLIGYPADSMIGFEPLERAPSGTTSKVLILFSEALTPQELYEAFIEPLGLQAEDGNSATPLTLVSSQLVIANPSYYMHTPIYPYGPDQKDVDENRGEDQASFQAYDNQAHADSLIGNLQLLKERNTLVETLFPADLLDSVDIDEAMKEIENNGVRYFGAFLTTDTKALLEFKGNPKVHSIQVESIVLW